MRSPSSTPCNNSPESGVSSSSSTSCRPTKLRSRCASPSWWNWAHERLAMASAAMGTPPGTRRSGRPGSAGDCIAAADDPGRVAAKDDPHAAGPAGRIATGCGPTGCRAAVAASCQSVVPVAADRRSGATDRRTGTPGPLAWAGTAARPIQRVVADRHLAAALAARTAGEDGLSRPACLSRDGAGTPAQPDTGRGEAEARTDRIRRVAGGTAHEPVRGGGAMTDKTRRSVLFAALAGVAAWSIWLAINDRSNDDAGDRIDVAEPAAHASRPARAVQVSAPAAVQTKPQEAEPRLALSRTNLFPEQTWYVPP